MSHLIFEFEHGMMTPNITLVIAVLVLSGALGEHTVPLPRTSNINVKLININVWNCLNHSFIRKLKIKRKEGGCQLPNMIGNMTRHRVVTFFGHSSSYLRPGLGSAPQVQI